MKKMFTLLVAVTIAAAASAQYDGGKQKDLGYDGYSNDYKKVFDKTVFSENWKKDQGRFARDNYSKRELEIDIAEVNQVYDRKIRMVKMNFFMPHFRKQQMVKRLEFERQDEIKQLYAKFYAQKNRNNDYSRRNW
jgi:hypothetical protein